MPTGRGFADLVFIPKQEFLDVPAMILELKWNQSADTALRQIKDKKYDSILDSYHGNVLLVGINYDKESKSHDCIIALRKQMFRTFRILRFKDCNAAVDLIINNDISGEL